MVGLSNNAARAAYGVALRLKSLGMEIIPVHPSAPLVHGSQGFSSLAEVPGAVDVVDVFVNATLAGAVVDQAIERGASAVWLQLDVVDHDAADRAMAAGLDVVMDRCPAIEAGRLAL